MSKVEIPGTTSPAVNINNSIIITEKLKCSKTLADYFIVRQFLLDEDHAPDCKWVAVEMFFLIAGKLVHKV